MRDLTTIEMFGVVLTVAMIGIGYLCGLIQWIRNKNPENKGRSTSLLDNELSGAPD